MNAAQDRNQPSPEGSSQGSQRPAKPTRIRRKRTPVMILMNIVIVGLVLTGLYLILQPYYLHWRQDRKTAELITALDEGDGTIVLYEDQLAVPGEEEEFLDQIEDWEDPTDPTGTETGETTSSGSSATGPSNSTGPGETTAATTAKPTTKPTPKPTPKPITIKAIGQINIEKINLTMPIADRAEAAPLRVAVGLLGGSAMPGEPGNTIILGHRMYTYGRHFNRLNEVVAGDRVIITTKTRKLTYRVDRQVTILPSQLREVLSEYTTEKKLILVTCTPVRVASHRLLVYATLESDTPV